MSKTIEEIAKEYVWEKNLGNMGINTFLKESLFEPIYHIEIIAQRYAQSQTQELQEQNAELVKMLEYIFYKTNFQNHFPTTSIKVKNLLTKHNHLNKKP